MCGRVIQSSGPLRLAIVDGLNVADSRMDNVPPRYNAAPSQELLIIRQNHKTGERSLDLIKWGLIPHWCTDPSGGRKPINAKVENISRLPTFRDAYALRRCIVPVDGFFEWRAIKGARKQPYAIARKDGLPFGLAGLWENWRNPNTGALWKVMAAFKLCEKHQDPSLTIRNRAPKGRNAIFTEGQVVRLVKRAWRMNKKGLACIMASAWDTAFSPVDCRTVAPAQWFADKTGSFFVKYRQKVEFTDENAVAAIGTVSRRTERLIEAYLADLGTELLPNTPMFRNQRGTAYSKDALCRSFRKVLKAAFPGDTRKLMDFRRSGSQEAQAGDVSPLALATKLANSISQSKRLQDTYLPKRAATVRLADEARKRGRQKLRAERSANEKLKLAGRDS
jgi:putative SOS response-associated peptidase YedK